MITAGLGVLVMALLCGVGFIASTVRADAELGAVTTSGLDGPRRWWLLATALLGVAGVALLAGGVFGS